MRRRPRERLRPGQVRDAILGVLSACSVPMAVKEIEDQVLTKHGNASSSSVRSYLRLNTPGLFVKEGRGVYGLKREQLFQELEDEPYADNEKGRKFSFGKATLYETDCFKWLKHQPDASIHAIVTDPPYGLHEYSEEQQQKLRNKKGGVWRIPPSFDGVMRSPLPRFTTLTRAQLNELREFFREWGRLIANKVVPGANVVVASNPLLSYIVSNALDEAGLERRGEIIRLVMTMRGGDRPKDAHKEFENVSVMPRSMWEPWLVYRRMPEGRIQDNLRKWRTGGFRRPSMARPFGDVIRSSPTSRKERAIAQHPSLKPQAFMREIVRGVLPLGEGIVVDPFAGAGSTLAAAEFVGYSSAGVETDPKYFNVACAAIPKLSVMPLRTDKLE